MSDVKKKIKRVKKKIRKTNKRGTQFLRKKFTAASVKIFEPIIARTAKIDPKKISIITLSGAYSCNPKYLYEELQRENSGFHVTWLVPDKKKLETYPKDADTVLLSTVNGIKAAYSSKYWIDNGVMFSEYFEKRKGQVHIQLMHGSLGIKKLDNAIGSRLKKGNHGKTVIRRESENTDYVITNSEFEENAFRTVFWKNVPMLRFGHARTDILFSTDEERKAAIRKELKERYGIPEDYRLALYAPTHRGGVSEEDLNIDHARLCKALEKRFGGRFAVMMRLHQRTHGIDLQNEENVVYNTTDYPDIQELMYVTDVGITDYSSWIYDYVLTGRPGFIYATDRDYYVERTGFFYPLEETPFPVCNDNEELEQAVLSFDEDLYQKRVKEFLEDKKCVDDGHAAERLAKWLKEN